MMKHDPNAIPQGRPTIILDGRAIRLREATIECRTPSEWLLDRAGATEPFFAPAGYYEYNILDTSGRVYRGKKNTVAIMAGKTREIWCLE